MKKTIANRIWLLSLLAIFILVSGIPTTCVAEDSEDNVDENLGVASAEEIRLDLFKKAARRILNKKLTLPNGDSAKVYVLKPINYTDLKTVEPIVATIEGTIQSYDQNIDVRISDQTMPALTLESFRLAVAKLNAEIVIISVLNTSSFEMYMYDKRTPSQIYAHTEPLASAARYQLNTEAAVYYTKLLIRRTLYRYIRNQYYEMPRDDSPPLLQSEIPRYIASSQSLELINREARSHFYVSAGLGAAISRGSRAKYWNSNLLSGQLALRVYDKLYLEGSFNMFAYNAVVGSIKYLFSNRDSSFRIMGGIGFSRFLRDRQVLNWDQTEGGLENKSYIVPSVSLLLPIADIYLKAEAQVYMPFRTTNRYVFAVMPGLLFMF
ncbi:MAG: hypothetical protein FJ116_08610 [Deltaproteobacteria bacterium]|nr:hypothetical protein [Deltaproteobacteria bacterium]